MIDYSVEVNKLKIIQRWELPLDSKAAEEAIKYFDNTGDFSAIPECQEILKIYRAERQKFLATLDNNHFAKPDKLVADKPTEDNSVKVNLDTSALDAAIAKADNLIAKLKTIKLLINCLDKK